MSSIDLRTSIPESSATVDVSIINSTTHLLKGPGSDLVKPVYRGLETIDAPSYSFLIHHKKTDSRLLFDAGLRKNWRTHLSPHLVKVILGFGLEIEVEKDVATLLQEHGTQPHEIGAIILSHHHWDHTGDLTLFPASTKLIVGTGYTAKYLPGWPKDPEAVVTTSDTYEGREIVELEFSLTDPKVGKIASHSAYDWFGDGSLYILGTPGHTKSHLSCLARTTTDDGVSTFMFFGGDIAHHCSLLRPSKYCPLPEMISPAPYDKAISDSTCSTERYTSIHRARDHSDSEDKSWVSPFCIVPEGFVDEDTAETQATIDKSLVLDGDENVFTVLAHDSTLLDVVDFFPKVANDWKAKCWGQQGHWRFLGSLHGEPA